MLHCEVVFFVSALLAAVLGLWGVAVGAIEVAKVLFLVFLAMSVATCVVGLVKGRVEK